MGIWISGFGLWIQGFGFGVEDLESKDYIARGAAGTEMFLGARGRSTMG